MENEIVLPLPSNFEVVLDFDHSPKNLDAETQNVIENIWEKELIRTQGKLFNGNLFSADNFDGIQLYGHFVEYKHFLAQVREPQLFELLAIKPVCVCGYTVDCDHILIGKRSDYVTEFQNYYELVPAGGIDTSAIHNDKIDIIKQLYTELKEEAGIEVSMVKKITPSFLVKYSDVQPFEICSKIELHDSTRDALGKHDEEYTELIWIKKNKIREFVEKNREGIIPLSVHLIDLFA